MDSSKGKRLNLIGAMSMAEFKLIVPMTFESNCKHDQVENWLHTLGLALPKDKTGGYLQRFLIMDNARFHNGGDLKHIASLYNTMLLYLSLYSPELNPMEISGVWLSKTLGCLLVVLIRSKIVLITVQFDLGFTI